ncbi:hypothetical protein [Ligilactobacillus acidipiscis]|uniref:hypothetical protein n=1 Tax=Ligilactobacillus acidipiscis TaxID=89059 RepID=UPI0023F8DBE5|nr:hypothetical protein [Ligilactobacillus acidipiscis]WEV57839.1 hypothetical protein OZX66_04690 [Ligilactobacillus acidipiscis]
MTKKIDDLWIVMNEFEGALNALLHAKDETSEYGKEFYKKEALTWLSFARKTLHVNDNELPF